MEQQLGSKCKRPLFNSFLVHAYSISLSSISKDFFLNLSIIVLRWYNCEDSVAVDYYVTYTWFHFVRLLLLPQLRFLDRAGISVGFVNSPKLYLILLIPTHVQPSFRCARISVFTPGWLYLFSAATLQVLYAIFLHLQVRTSAMGHNNSNSTCHDLSFATVNEETASSLVAEDKSLAWFGPLAVTCCCICI